MLEAISIIPLDRIDSSLCPPSAEVTKVGQLRDTWSSRLICCWPWRYFQGRASLKLHSPRQSDIERWYSWRHYDESGSSTEQQHPDCRCRQLEPNWGWLVETYTPTDRAIEPLSLRWIQLRIRPRLLQGSCTPEVSTSTRLLHCRIWSHQPYSHSLRQREQY